MAQFPLLASRSLRRVPRANVRAPEYPRLGGWVIERPLAAGAQAEIFRVYRAGDPARHPFVAKAFRLQGSQGEQYLAEEQRWRCRRAVTALRSLSDSGCPGIVAVVESHLEEGPAVRPWYVMPFYAGGPMRHPYVAGEPPCFAEDFRGNINRVLEIAEALAITLAFMHAHQPRCLHRDLNAGNVFLRSAGSAPVLGDFGTVHVNGFPKRPDSAQAVSGAWFWRPPEWDRTDSCTPDPASDVFMLGGLIYEALSGGEYLPASWQWNGSFPHELPEHSLRRYTSDPRIKAVDELLRATFQPEPQNRISAAALAAACREQRAI